MARSGGELGAKSREGLESGGCCCGSIVAIVAFDVREFRNGCCDEEQTLLFVHYHLAAKELRESVRVIVRWRMCGVEGLSKICRSPVLSKSRTLRDWLVSNALCLIAVSSE